MYDVVCSTLDGASCTDLLRLVLSASRAGCSDDLLLCLCRWRRMRTTHVQMWPFVARKR